MKELKEWGNHFGVNNHTKGDIIIIIDSDGQHDPVDIPKICVPILNGECDFVIGSRYLGEYYYMFSILKRTGETSSRMNYI